MIKVGKIFQPLVGKFSDLMICKVGKFSIFPTLSKGRKICHKVGRKGWKNGWKKGWKNGLKKLAKYWKMWTKFRSSAEVFK